MNDQSAKPSVNYLKLKRVSTLGFMAVLVWFSIVSAILFLLSGDLLGLPSLAIGIAILALPLTSQFRNYWSTGNTARAFPIIIFAANIGLIIIYGNVFLALISDPFVFYNDQNTFAVFLWGGATILSIFSILANVGAFILDRRQLTQIPA